MANRAKRATYLTKLRIKNARAFLDEHELDLCDGNGYPARWTLILGENGVGKTTLLECLANLAPFANTLDEDGTKKPDFFLEPVGFADNEGLERLSRRGDIEFDIRATYATKIALEGATKSRGDSFEIGVQFQRRSGKVHEVTLIKSDKGTNAEPLVMVYGAGRRMGVGNLETSVEAAPATALFDDTVQLVDAEELIQQLDYAALKRNNDGAMRQRDVFLDMVAALLPDVGDRSKIEIYGPSPVRRGGKTGVHVRTPYGEVPLRQLSFGYQTMTAWLADIAWRLFTRFPASKNPLLEPAIVLVDEIDLHLHPRWQRDLRRRLTQHFPAVQFIATAHSPSMAQANMGENLAVVRRDNDAACIDNNPTVVRNWRIDQVITSELFGLATPWPPDVEQMLEEQAKLTAKAHRSPVEQTRLEEIESSIAALPGEESPEIADAMDIIRRAAAAFSEPPPSE